MCNGEEGDRCNQASPVTDQQQQTYDKAQMIPACQNMLKSQTDVRLGNFDALTLIVGFTK